MAIVATMSTRLERSRARRDAWAKLPRRWNRNEPVCFNPHLCCNRNPERLLNKIKHVRRVATPYDNLATNYLACPQPASMQFRPRANECTTSSNYLVILTATFGAALSAIQMTNGGIYGSISIAHKEVHCTWFPQNQRQLRGRILGRSAGHSEVAANDIKLIGGKNKN